MLVEDLERNTLEKKNLINKMLPYSAIKIIANPTLPYSTLNPETSSDSPSAKSKGVRLVSARQEISQIPTKGRNRAPFIQALFNPILSVKLNLPTKIK